MAAEKLAPVTFAEVHALREELWKLEDRSRANSQEDFRHKLSPAFGALSEAMRELAYDDALKKARADQKRGADG